ncbi:LacI family transcriptional regulator [Oceanotoga sp. DSM 15011]|jgi:LacI family transcriptional regulator|uniref:LacI family transcriptional regulator n=1 Tax=Oceanotoga teriensis TaxID=515440 RepID=A0AA45C859_9BACT|nr:MULTISPECIES: LacI family DNA-binding transcriptional regulator [Oceanotoga]MDN5341133.1 LacI family transcriptional regulator [Oceanotoga sp.]MDO7976815.1 LacI family transcriptional regulator [Oceanotoga teriensis]PWJ95891.1 LacI family transcriptional regulator [Oceanotoga teriensis]UYP00883.1 LacI family transcriptional regulator [Oceanotoga sp. DSM 15011]
MTKKYITIKDVAKEMGVSINTVSRALNNKPDINEDTKNKILKKAKEMGYVRNSYASLLKSKYSKIIGVIIPDSSNPFFSEVFNSIEKSARKKDYQLIVMNSEGLYENESKAVEVFIERRVDGILLFPMQKKYEDIKGLISNKFPIVCVGRNIIGWDMDEIYNNDLEGGYLATKHLIDQGFKNIIMISDELFNSASKHRIEGFKKALNENDLNYKNNIIICEKIHEGKHVEAGYKTILKLLKENKKFDGVFCYNDLIAFGVLKALKENNIKVPYEIGVIGFDDIKFSSLITPSLSTIRVNKEKLGEEAFNMLYKKIKNPKQKLLKQKLEIELLIRDSSLKIRGDING